MLESSPARAGEPATDLRDFALAVALLSAAGFSCAFCLSMWLLPDSLAFLTRNKLGTPAERQLLLGLLGLSVLTPISIALLLRIRFGSAATEGLQRVARMLSPLALVGLLPGLLSWQLGHNYTLFYLVLLALLALLLRPAFEQAFLAASTRPSETSSTAYATAFDIPGAVALPLVVLAGAGYAVYMSYYTILNHHLIQTTAFDLGIYDNLMFNALKGNPFHSPVLFGPGDRNYLAGHAELGMLLFVPFYAIAPRAETLLVIQACAFGLAAIPLYLLASRNLPRYVAVLVSFVYLLFAPLHQPNFYDFHWLPTAVFFHFWLYFALATRRNVLLWVMLAVLFLIREDVSVGTAALGLFLAVATDRARLGLAMMAISAVWFVGIKFVLMPSMGSWWFDAIYKGLFADGTPGYASVVRTLISNPPYAISTLLTADKATYLLHMTAALAFLPVRRPLFWLLLAPGMLFTILTTEYWPTTSIRFQYTGHWIAYLFLAVVLSLRDLRSSSRVINFTGDGDQAQANDQPGRVRLMAAVATLVVCGVCHSYAFGAVLQHEKAVGGFREVRFVMTDAERARYTAMRQLVDRIPREASVAATEYMSPHVSARKESYVPRQSVGTPDYIFVSSREVHGNVKKVLGDTFRKREYVLVGSSAKEFYLFRRGRPDAATKAALRTLHLPQHGKP